MDICRQSNVSDPYITNYHKFSCLKHTYYITVLRDRSLGRLVLVLCLGPYMAKIKGIKVVSKVVFLSGGAWKDDSSKLLTKFYAL